MMADSNRASTDVGRNCRDTWAGDLRAVSQPADSTFRYRQRRVLKEDCQPGFYRCDEDIAGIFRSRLGQTLFIDPPAAPPMRTGGVPRTRCQPGFYRCGDDSAGILGSGLIQTPFLDPPAISPVRTGGHPGQIAPTGLLPVWRTTYENATNRASTGVATELFSQICAREGAETRTTG
jgi:hypothetical protein